MNCGRLYGVVIGLVLLCAGPAFCADASATTTATPAAKHKKKRRKTAAVTHAGTATASTTQAGVIHTNATYSVTKVALARRTRRHKVFFNPWTEPTYADSTVGDNIDGEDLVVRKAAVDAIGPFNGSVVVVDPQTGRILSVVNQKLAFKGAYQPCSTVKMVVSAASLSEGIIDPTKRMHITRRVSMDMTDALAHSNNLYFAKMGEELGFDRVEKYAKLFGLGEKAGLDIPGEEAGFLTPEPPNTGVGMMTSFGDGIRLTPVELASVVSTIANGGTMYYLQYPRSEEEVQKFVPRIKRELELASIVPSIKAGMMGAVEYGTARRAGYDLNEPILGKTGTCTDTIQPGVHLGWFGSFNDVGTHKLVVVVLLTGGRGVSGSVAASVAGNVYHNLSQQRYFASDTQLQSSQPVIPTALISLGH